MAKMLIKKHRRLCPHSSKHGVTVDGHMRKGRRVGTKPATKTGLLGLPKF